MGSGVCTAESKLVSRGMVQPLCRPSGKKSAAPGAIYHTAIATDDPQAVVDSGLDVFRYTPNVKLAQQGCSWKWTHRERRDEEDVEKRVKRRGWAHGVPPVSVVFNVNDG